MILEKFSSSSFHFLNSWVYIRPLHVVVISQLQRKNTDLCSDEITAKDLSPQAPVAQKIADELVFRRFQGEGIDLF